MAEIPDILPERIDFDPSADFTAFLRLAPARWVVYLMADAQGRPLQLLCVKNLRHSLKRRLLGDDAPALSRRVNYREFVRRIFWRRVDSPLEADWIYHDIARQVFPQTFRGMTGFRPAWFVHFDPEAQFPRYVKTIDLTAKGGVYIGPVEDKHAAARLIELMEDAFDLCRYYHILVQAPAGRACPYKEMGKCPAPCDGSISMEQYRRMIQWSVETLADPREFLRDQTERMRQAAGDLRFETAAKIKTFIDQLEQLGKGPYRHARRLEDFAFVALERGPSAGTAKVFLILRGQVEEIAGFIAEPTGGELLPAIQSAATNAANIPLDETGIERIGIVAHHLFSPRQIQGVFIPLADLSEATLAKAYKALARQKQPQESDGEGVIKELEAP